MKITRRDCVIALATSLIPAKQLISPWHYSHPQPWQQRTATEKLRFMLYQQRKGVSYGMLRSDAAFSIDGFEMQGHAYAVAFATDKQHAIAHLYADECKLVIPISDMSQVDFEREKSGMVLNASAQGNGFKPVHGRMYDPSLPMNYDKAISPSKNAYERIPLIINSRRYGFRPADELKEITLDILLAQYERKPVQERNVAQFTRRKRALLAQLPREYQYAAMIE